MGDIQDGGANLAAVSRSTATLRFFGDDLVPERLSSTLGGLPTEAWRKGDQIVGKVTTRIATTGSWRRASTLPPESSIEGHIESVLAGLTNDLATWTDLANRFDGDVFCGVFLEHLNEGFELSPATTRLLSERGLVIDFDIYGAFDSDNEPAV